MLYLKPERALHTFVRAFAKLLIFLGLSTSVDGFAFDSAPGKFVKVNAHEMHIYCTGSGLPTVVLEAGLGGTSLEWLMVQRQLSHHTRVCSYDRPGYGWSELTTAPRNATTIAAELKDLLVASGEPGPYILVGHSLGGHIVRLFTAKYFDNVAGLVLVDASHENMFDHFDKIKSGKFARKKRSLTGRPRVPKNLPEELQQITLRMMNQFQTRFAIQSESRLFRRSAEEVRASSVLPKVPVIVISRGPGALGHGDRNDVIAKHWHLLQQDLHSRLSSSKHVIASNSGHYPHLDQPELVSSTILEQVKNFNSVWLSKL